MNKKGDFDFEWLPGFREMMACQNEEQNTQQETDWGNENLQIEALLPPEQLQQEEQRYWKDYEYFIQMLPMVAREGGLLEMPCLINMSTREVRFILNIQTR